MQNYFKFKYYAEERKYLVIPCELELELPHFRGQKGLKLSQVGDTHFADIQAVDTQVVGMQVADTQVVDMQVVDMQVEKMLPEDMTAFPATGRTFL